MPDFKDDMLKLLDELKVIKEKGSKLGREITGELSHQLKQAISLTERAIRGELNQTDWQKATGPLMLSLGKADVARQGADVTVVALGYARRKALAAAEQLAGEIDVEVIDPRTLEPLDLDTILASLEKTGRLLVVHESPTRCGVGSEIVRRVVEKGFDYLDAEPRVFGGADLPIPFSPGLEDVCLPQPDTIVTQIRNLVA